MNIKTKAGSNVRLIFSVKPVYTKNISIIVYVNKESMKASYILSLKAAHSTIQDWYSNLEMFEKKSIIRYGNVNIEDNGFYPDVE